MAREKTTVEKSLANPICGVSWASQKKSGEIKPTATLTLRPHPNIVRELISRGLVRQEKVADETGEAELYITNDVVGYMNEATAEKLANEYGVQIDLSEPVRTGSRVREKLAKTEMVLIETLKNLPENIRQQMIDSDDTVKEIWIRYTGE